MCMHAKVEKIKGAVLNELGLLLRVIEKLEMSVVSTCLECIRRGRGDRYVSQGVGLSLVFDREQQNVQLHVRKHVNIQETLWYSEVLHCTHTSQQLTVTVFVEFNVFNIFETIKTSLFFFNALVL